MVLYFNQSFIGPENPKLKYRTVFKGFLKLTVISSVGFISATWWVQESFTLLSGCNSTDLKPLDRRCAMLFITAISFQE